MPEQAVGQGEIRIEPDRIAVRDNGLVQPAIRLKRPGEATVGNGGVQIQPDRLVCSPTRLDGIVRRKL